VVSTSSTDGSGSTDGRRVAVLYNGTRSLFEREGFELVRKKGQRNTVMRKTVASSS
jgi:hypothetical protein